MAAHPQSVPATHFERRNYGRLAGVRPLAFLGGFLAIAALVVMVLASLQIVGAAATAHQRMLVPSGHLHYPGWMAGPFRGYGDSVTVHELDWLLVVLTALYLIVAACSRFLPLWLAAAAVVILTAVFTLAPPLFSTDIFNYVNYARLGVIHHINPYQHGAAAFPHDSSFRFTGHKWRDTPTAYGPLFTLLSYAFVHLGVGGAMWALKAVNAVAALGCAGLVAACARKLGIRPAPAMLFFALNPLVLVYAVGGGHNDVLMALPLLAGAYLILDDKPELGGAAIVAAAAIKLTAGLALPFVLVACRSRWRVLLGAAIAAVVIAAAGLAVFGIHVTNIVTVLRNHDELTSGVTSIPGYIGHAIGVGGLNHSRRVVMQGFFGVIALVLLYYAWRRRDWLAAAAGAFVVLVATLGWLLPWYAVWALALAPIARRRSVVIGALALTAVVLAIQINIYNKHFQTPPGGHGNQALGMVHTPRVPARAT